MDNLQLIIYLNMTLETLRIDKEDIEKKLEGSMSARDKRGLLEELRLVKLQIKALEYAARFFKQISVKIMAK